MKASKDLVAASATPIILSVLLEGESYGYEIIRRVRMLSAGTLDWSEGMVYPALRRLEERGLLKARWVAADGERRRRYYSITTRGREELAAEREVWRTINSALVRLWRPHEWPA